MRRLALMCAIFAVVGMSCSDASPRDNRLSENERQLAVLEEQNEAYQRQLDKGAEALRRAEEQDKRFDAILDKWEEQARRYDAILDRWERMLPPSTEDKKNPNEST